MLLKELIERNGMSAYRLQKITGIPAMTLNYIVKEDKLNKTSVENGIKIAEALGITLDEMYRMLYR